MGPARAWSGRCEGASPARCGGRTGRDVPHQWGHAEQPVHLLQSHALSHPGPSTGTASVTCYALKGNQPLDYSCVLELARLTSALPQGL